MHTSNLYFGGHYFICLQFIVFINFLRVAKDKLVTSELNQRAMAGVQL